MRVVDVILASQPKIVSISGGEPLSVRWAVEAMKRLHDAGIDVTVYTSGWTMKERLATALAEAVSSVAVSIDGADAVIHNAMRGRAGAFERGMKALEILHQVKDERRAAGQSCFTFGIDYTLTRSGSKEADLKRFVEAAIKRFPEARFHSFWCGNSRRLGCRAKVRGERASVDRRIGRSARCRPAPCSRQWQRRRDLHDQMSGLSPA